MSSLNTSISFTSPKTPKSPLSPSSPSLSASLTLPITPLTPKMIRNRPRLSLSPSKHQKRMEKRMDNEKTRKEYDDLKIRYDALKKMYETSENNLDNVNKQLFVEKLKSNRLSQEIIALKKDNQQKIDEMVNEQQQKIKEMQKGYENDINSLKNTNEDERIALKLQQQKSLYDAHINLIRKDFGDQLEYHKVIEKQHKQIIFE